MIILLSRVVTPQPEKIKQIIIHFEEHLYVKDYGLFIEKELIQRVVTCTIEIVGKYNKIRKYKAMVRDKGNLPLEELQIVAANRVFTSNSKTIGNLRAEIMSELIMKGVL